MVCAAITRVFDEALKAAIPECSLTIDTWADTYRFLSPERSARPGKWDGSFVPYLRVPMRLLTRPDVQKLALWKSSQVAGTSFVENVIGYYIHIDPTTIFYAAEDEKKAEAWSVESFAPTVRDTPVLSALIGDPRTRDSGNKIGLRSFPGGNLALGWATSPATASSRPRCVVILDEIDAYARTSEGDYVKLAEARTRTYPNRKIILNSSPRNRVEPPPGSPPDAVAMSPIERAYHECDYRGRFLLPCPHCGEYQELKWRDETGYRIRWDGDDRLNAYFVCVHGCVVEHSEKRAMLAAGRWRFEGKPGEFFWEDELDGLQLNSVGFFVWEGYSPFTTWGEIAADQPPRHEVERLKVWLNTRLAEPWDELGDAASTDELEDRREPYDLVVPLGVLFLTFGADVQSNPPRIECEVVGWGADDESWSVDYRVFEGDPAQPAVWLQLENYLTQDFPCEWGGVMRVAAGAVDTGGHHTNEVYKFCRKHKGRRFYAIKGANTPGKPLAPPKPTMQSNPPVPLYLIGTEAAKDTFAAHLLIGEPGPGYCHFPSEREDPETGRAYYDAAYFKQLLSERPVVRGGVRSWQKIRASARNEALDVRVYNMAAKAILKPNMKALKARAARAAAAEPPVPDDGGERPPPEPTVEEFVEEEDRVPSRPASKPLRPRRGGGFVNNW